MAKQVPLNRTNRQSRKEPKLLEQMKDKLRVLRYAYRTEQSYFDWVEWFLRFSHQADGRWRHPRDMGKAEYEQVLSHLAINRNVSASTQKQALCAILFLYKQVLKIELPPLLASAASKPQRLPTVLSKAEVGQLIEAIDTPTYRLMAQLMYGSGLRLMEACRLRVKDVDFQRRRLAIWYSKGNKSRPVPLPEACADALRERVERAIHIGQLDKLRGSAGVSLPDAFDRKAPAAHHDPMWQYVFLTSVNAKASACVA